MKVRRVDSLTEFESLASVWAELARQSGQTSPFLSHDWFSCCWRAAGRSRVPEILMVEDTTGPVALVPLARSRDRVHGMPIRRLAHLTAPDTPFVDWLVAGRPEPVFEAVLEHLSRSRDWDVFSLNALPLDSPTHKALETFLSGRLRWERGATVRSPIVSISGDWDGYWTSKSQRFKKTVRGVRNRLNKAGEISIDEHREVLPESAIFLELLDVSRRSWKAEQRLAIATMPGMAEFFKTLTARATARGWLRLWILRVDGRAVATEYQLEAQGRVHALRADFDAGVPEELSPGTHLSSEVLRRLFDRGGVHEYDMGPGENPYKARWASGANETVTVRVFHPGLYGTLLNTVEKKAIPALRRVLGRQAQS